MSFFTLSSAYVKIQCSFFLLSIFQQELAQKARPVALNVVKTRDQQGGAGKMGELSWRETDDVLEKSAPHHVPSS